jgi:hypothetical protein
MAAAVAAQLADVGGSALIAAGAAFVTLAGIGQVLHRSVRARMHIATKPARSVSCSLRSARPCSSERSADHQRSC